MSASHSDGAFRGLPGAMRAAEDPARRLHAVTDHAAPAVLTRGRQRVDRAFEAIVRTGDAVEADLHRLRVLASTHYAACHGALLGSCLFDQRPAVSSRGCNAHARGERADDGPRCRGMSFASSPCRSEEPCLELSDGRAGKHHAGAWYVGG